MMVFNTTVETSRLMARPFQLCFHELLKMDGTLALCSVIRDQMAIHVWVIEDYDAETDNLDFEATYYYLGIWSNTTFKGDEVP